MNPNCLRWSYLDSDDLERFFQQTPFLEVELVTGLPKMDINRWGPSFLWLSSLEKVLEKLVCFD